jgi:hypothetical protein
VPGSPTPFRILLIEHLGQVRTPLEFEKNVVAEVLNSEEFELFGLKAIGDGSGWFSHLHLQAFEMLCPAPIPRQPSTSYTSTKLEDRWARNQSVDQGTLAALSRKR